MTTPTSPSPSAPAKVYGIEDFFREAKERGLTANDLVAGLRARGDTPADNTVQKALSAGEHLAKTVEQFLATLERVEAAQTHLDEDEHDEQSLAGARRDLAKAEESRADLWTAVTGDIASFRDRAMRAKESAEGLMSLQEVWDAAGGNPSKAPTRHEVLETLRLLDEVCEEAAVGLQRAAAGDLKPISHKEALKSAFLLARDLDARPGFGSMSGASAGEETPVQRDRP